MGEALPVSWRAPHLQNRAKLSSFLFVVSLHFHQNKSIWGE